jgi:hypothetical protein
VVIAVPWVVHLSTSLLKDTNSSFTDQKLRGFHALKGKLNLSLLPTIFLFIGNKRNSLKKSKGALKHTAIQGLYKDNKTKEKQKTNEEHPKKLKNRRKAPLNPQLSCL